MFGNENLSEYSGNSCISSVDNHSTYSRSTVQSFQTIKNPSVLKCYYCTNSHRAKLVKCICNKCDRYFCYNRFVAGTRTPHIISHLKQANHNMIQIVSNVKGISHEPSCFKCKNKNIFSLGFYKKSCKIICRIPCFESSLNANPLDFEPLINEQGLSNRLFAKQKPKKSQKNPQLKSNIFSSKQSQFSLQEIREIELSMRNLDLGNEIMPDYTLKIKRTYSSREEYAHVYDHLLTLESFEESIQNSKLVYKQVDLYFGGEENLDPRKFEFIERKLNNDQSRLRAMFFGYEIGCKFTDKDEILVSHESGWDSRARLISKDDGFFILEFNAPIQNFVTKIDMTVVSENSNCERLKAALETFQIKNIDKAITDTILGRQVEHQLGFDPLISDYTIKGKFQLNSSQIQAISTSLKTKVSIIHGPPGTGKTLTIVALVTHINNLCRPSDVENQDNLNCFINYIEKLIKKLNAIKDDNESRIKYYTNKIEEYKKNFTEKFNLTYEEYKNKRSYFSKDKKILVCAPSNHPVFDLREKLQKYELNVIQVIAKTKEEEHKNTKGTLRYETDIELNKNQRYDELLTKIANEKKRNQPDEIEIERMEKLLSGIRFRTEVEILQKYDIICCTCITSSSRSLKSINFNFVIVDEATQALEPEIIVCILKGATHLVLVGDKHQLGSMVASSKAKNLGLDNSMIERFEDISVPYTMLSTQYRMDPSISSFSNSTFYNNKIKDNFPVRTYNNFTFPSPANRALFLYHVGSKEEYSGNGASYVNRYEAEAIVSLIKHLRQKGIPGDEIGVITFYDGQKGFLMQYMELNLSPELKKGIDVMSVDASQGREKGFIILSCVRSNKKLGVGFLNEYRRLNVAMTRAKYGLVICANVTTLLSDPLWTGLVKYFDDQELVFKGEINALVKEKLKIGQVLKMNMNKHGKYADD